MIQQHIINSRHVLQLANKIQTSYKGGFTNQDFNSDYQISCKTEEDYVQYLSNIKDKNSIIKYIVDPVVKFGVFVANDFRKGDQVLYINGSFEIDVTKEYFDSYARHFKNKGE